MPSERVVVAICLYPRREHGTGRATQATLVATYDDGTRDKRRVSADDYERLATEAFSCSQPATPGEP